MGSVVWVQCATCAECINLSIAESTVTDTLESRVHHGSTLNKYAHLICTEDGSEAIVLSQAMYWSGCDRCKDHGPCIGQVVIAVRITDHVLVGL